MAIIETRNRIGTTKRDLNFDTINYDKVYGHSFVKLSFGEMNGFSEGKHVTRELMNVCK